MLAAAVALGALPPTDPSEGLEVVLRIARVVNSVPSAGPYTGTPYKPMS